MIFILHGFCLHNFYIMKCKHPDFWLRSNIIKVPVHMKITQEVTHSYQKRTKIKLV